MSDPDPNDLGEALGSVLGLTKVDHVALAVRDLERALELYVGVLGGRFVLGGDNDETGNRVVHVALGGFKLELLSPLRSGTLLDRTLEARGEGMHHITAVVADLPRAITALTEHGIEVTGTDLSNPIWCETFVRPRHNNGLLMQLVTTTREWGLPVDGIGLEEVLAGDVTFRHAWPCRRTSLVGREGS